MSPEHRRFVLLENGLGSALINFAINGAIAWLLFRGMESVPLWGQQSIAGDTIGTCFFLPFVTTLIVTPLGRGRLRQGLIGSLGAPESVPVVAWLPAGTVKRGLALGAVCVALVAPLMIGWLAWRSIDSLQFWSFVSFKATFAAVLAAAVTPIIAAAAISGERAG